MDVTLSTYTVERVGYDASEPEPKEASGHYTVLLAFDDGTDHRVTFNAPEITTEEEFDAHVKAYALSYLAGRAAAATPPVVQPGPREA